MIEFAAAIGIDPEDESEETSAQLLQLWQAYRNNAEVKIPQEFIKEKHMINPVKDVALSLHKKTSEVLSATLTVAEHTDNVDLATNAIKSLVAHIESVMAEATPLKTQTYFLKDAKNAIVRAQAQLDRPWHHITDEDTADGRAHAMYSLHDRLVDSRQILIDFLNAHNK